VNCDGLTLAMVPDTDEGSGTMRPGPIPVGRGTDHNEIAKQSMKKVASETAARKRMMEYTSKLMEFDWASKRWHEEGQRGHGIHSLGEKEKKRVNGWSKD